MPTDFAAEYSTHTDGELLHVASARHLLVPEAAAALDSELRRRNLTESDRIEYKKSVKREERRESRSQTKLRRRWEKLGLKWQLSGREILEMFAVMAVVVGACFALPSRYHFAPDWEEAAVVVTLTSAGLTFMVRSWRNILFWISLAVSSVIHLFVIHAWTRKIPELNHNEGRGAIFLGFVLFLIVYLALRQLRRVFHAGEDDQSILHGRDNVVE